MVKRIWGKYLGKEFPLIKIDTQTDANQIVFMPNFHTSHITLHKEKDGKLLFTHYDDYKEHGTWDKYRALAAKNHNYQKWERHENYYYHGYLSYPIVGFTGKIWGAYLCGIRYELNKIITKSKYLNDDKEVFDLNSEAGLCNFYFSEFDEYQPPSYDHVTETVYGKLYLITS